MRENITISWYGRCCFLVEIAKIKVLFDPYDMYANVEIGTIDSDVLISSSTWHDHGHIGASPSSHIYSYAGDYTNSDIKITGIESKEDRRTPNIVFNIQYKDFSITNFADFGPTQEDYFQANTTNAQRKVLQSTNIAFARPMIVRDTVGEKNIHNENFLKYCSPNVIIPEHYHPRSFINVCVPENTRHEFEPANILVDELPETIDYPVQEIDNYKLKIDNSFWTKKSIYRFMQIHPQVKYKKNLNLKRS